MSTDRHKSLNALRFQQCLAVASIVLLLILYGLMGDTQSVSISHGSALLWMIHRWNGSGGDLTHGWLIPLVSGWVVWTRREALRNATCRRDWWAIPLIVGCLLLHWVGFRTQLTRLSLLSLVGLSWSIPLFLCGPAVARRLVFPCAYLIFCIPLSFLDGLTVPLRVFMSRITALLLNGVGIPALRYGTTIHSEAGGGFSFDVADPCSGLRALLVMAALTAAYAAITQKSLLRQWLLFLAAIPVAIIGNVARILAIALVAEIAGSDIALGFYHDYSGYVVFAVAVLAMVGVGQLLSIDWHQWIEKHRGKA